jgi:sulfur carrier protein
MMRIRLNGSERDVAADARIADVIALLTTKGAGCAVAINDEVVPRHEWDDRTVAEGDRVEVLTAAQGG